MSYKTTFEVVVWMPRASEMAPASLFSLTPNATFPFFFAMGMFSVRKVDSSYDSLPVREFIAFSRAVLASLNP